MYVGIDIGGMSLKAGLVDEHYHLIDSLACPVDPRHADFEQYLAERLWLLTQQLLAKNELTAAHISYVGAGVPGPVDPASKTILFTPNLPLTLVPLGQLFQAYSPVPLLLGNDANCAALGEYYAGSGRGAQSMVMLTLGTGVGSGLILDGKLYTGFNGAAAEAGHLLIEMDGRPCGCGRRGCLESYASASALIRDTIDAMLTNRNSLLWEVAGGSLDNVTGQTPFSAKHMGDPAAIQVCQQYIHYLSEGIINIINLLQPEIICLGGGVSRADDEDLLIPLRQTVDSRNMSKHSQKHPQIVKSALGNDAGIIGAALLGLSE